MKNFYKKLVLCVVVAAVGTTSLVGCGKKPTTQTAPGAEKAVPQTNLYVPKFDEDKNLMIFADCPISPSEINLKDYIAAGFTYYTMTEDTYPLTNADRKLGTADDGVINPLYTDVLERCDDLGLKVIIRNCWNDPYYFVNTSDETRHFEPPFDYVSYNIPIRNITTELTKYKAVAGYYLTDEPSWNRIEDHTPQVEWYNKYGGNTLFHLNLLQSYGSFMFEGHSFEEYVDHYCDVILKNVNGPKTLSTDYYPLEQTGDTKEPYIKDGFLSDYIILAEKVKEMNEQVTDENDKVRLNLYIQAYKSNDKGEMLVTQAEYHDTTCEGVLPLDDDVVLHVAPATQNPVPELTEAFIVPKGTMVKLNVGVWHLAAMPIHLDTAHVMITLPERIYKTDCVVVDYKPEQYVKIEL